MEKVWIKNGKGRTRGYKFPCKICGRTRIVRKYRMKLYEMCHSCRNKQIQDLRKVYKYENSDEYNKMLDRRKLAIKIKGNICNKCGAKNLPIFCYCFHHPDPKAKEFPVLGPLVGIEKWKKELEKTNMLCLHCHKIEHYGTERLDL